jgi:hypothetical protein|tara:strand:+ start:169 stop:411 length:243 start_codon:yes stop_codon:yes gene_type:complete
VVRKGDAFNLEKENKIINPHRVDTTTINAKVYKQHTIQPKERIRKSAFVEFKPSVNLSAYGKSFPNWQNGKNDVYHEKQP